MGYQKKKKRRRRKSGEVEKVEGFLTIRRERESNSASSIERTRPTFDFYFPRGRILGSTWNLGYAIRTNLVVRPSETAWFPQAVSSFIPREIFARPRFANCTPSGRLLSHPQDKASQFQRLSYLSFFSSFGVSSFLRDQTREFSLTPYITEPQNIDHHDFFHSR